MRVPISYALTYPDRAATPAPQLDLAAGLELRFEAPDLDAFPLLGARPRRRRAGRHGAVRLQRRERGGRRRLPRRTDRLPRDRRDRGGGARRRPTGPRRATSTTSSTPTREARAAATGEAGSGMTIAVSILGLAFLILVHELGHFLVSLALGMRPRRFYIGFPPAVWKTTRGGIEYGIGAIPLGGFVKIPGMHRPAPADVDIALGRAVEEAPGLAGPDGPAALGASRPATTTPRGTRGRRACGEQLEGRVAAPSRAQGRRERGLDDLDDALGPDAYWRAATWKRVAAIAAGPGGEHPARVRPLHRALHDVGRQGDDDRRQRPRPDSPAASAGLAPGRPHRLDRRRRRSSRTTIAEAIGASEGEPIVVVVERDGDDGHAPGDRAGRGRRRVPPRASSSPARGSSLPAAVGESVTLTWTVTAEIGTSLGRLVQGEGREDISSPVGIVQGSSDAAKDGAQSFLVRPRADLALDRAAQPAAAPPARRRAHRLRGRGGHPRPRRATRDLRARVGRRDRARAAAVLHRPVERRRATGCLLLRGIRRADPLRRDRACGRETLSGVRLRPPPGAACGRMILLRAAPALSVLRERVGRVSAAESAAVLGAGISTAPSIARWGVSHWTSSSAPLGGACARGAARRGRPARPSTRRCDAGTSTRPRRGRRSRRRRGRRRALVVPGLDRVRPAEAVQLLVGRRRSRRRSSRRGRAGSAQPATTSANAVSTRISKRAADAPHGARRRPLERDDAARRAATTSRAAPSAAASGRGRGGRPRGACPARGRRRAPRGRRGGRQGARLERARPSAAARRHAVTVPSRTRETCGRLQPADGRSAAAPTSSSPASSTREAPRGWRPPGRLRARFTPRRGIAARRPPLP